MRIIAGAFRGRALTAPPGEGTRPTSDRARQAAVLLDGYGLARADRVGFVDRMIEFAIRAARDEAVSSQVGPETPSPSPHGFPLLWAVTWRARSAAWMLDHRAVLQTTIERSAD